MNLFKKFCGEANILCIFLHVFCVCVYMNYLYVCVHIQASYLVMQNAVSKVNTF